MGFIARDLRHGCGFLSYTVLLTSRQKTLTSKTLMLTLAACVPHATHIKGTVLITKERKFYKDAQLFSTI